MPATARADRLIIEDPEITLSQLAAQWRDARAKADAAWSRVDDAQRQANKLYSAKPQGGLYGPFQTARDQSAADFWWRQHAAFNAFFGLVELEAVAGAASGISEALGCRILAMRAETVEEAAMKFAIILRETDNGEGEFDDEAPVRDFLEDLEQLARRARRARTA